MAGSLRREREIAALAEAAAAAMGTPDSEARQAALRAVVDEVGPAITRLAGVDPGAAQALAGNSAMLWQDAGRVDEGRRVVDVAIAATEEPSRGLARSLLAASDLAFRQADPATAEARARDAIRIAEHVGDRSTESIGHGNLARIALRRGDAPAIERHARRALDVAGDDVMGRRGALHMLAWAAHAAGDLPEARRRFEASLVFRRTLGDRFAVAVELANLGDMAAADGDLPAAARQLVEALEIGSGIGSRYMSVNLLPSFAELAARAGHDDEAVRLVGAASAVAQSSGLVPDPGGLGEGTEARLRSRVGDARFATLFGEGAALGEPEAVALAVAIGNAIPSS